MPDANATFKVANPWVRRWLWVVLGLVSAMFVVLYLFPRDTDEMFAWSIASPMTAAFLGASYGASFPLYLVSSFRRYWADVRLAFFGVGVFTLLTMAATFVHLDKFHTDSATGWTWITTYILAPIIMLGIVVSMSRAPGTDPPRIALLAGWLRALMLGIALVLVPLGAALFIAPGWADGAWPWTLTELTGRAVGAWLVGIGIVVLHIAWENDWVRVAPGPPAFALLGLLHLGAVARFRDEFNWSGVGAWLYVAGLVLFTALGVYGIVKCRRLGIQFTPAGMAARPVATATQT